MKDPPRMLLSLLATVLGALFIASLIFEEYLPDYILGLNKICCHGFLLLGAISANSGGRLLDWLRRRANSRR